MHWHLPDDLAINADLCEFVESYRSRYLDFFLDYFEIHRAKGSRGGYFNINSVSGRPYEHNHCYSWTDGRSLGELTAAYLYGLGDRERLRPYISILWGLIDDMTEMAISRMCWTTHESCGCPRLEREVKPGQSSFSHVVLCSTAYGSTPWYWASQAQITCTCSSWTNWRTHCPWTSF